MQCSHPNASLSLSLLLSPSNGNGSLLRQQRPPRVTRCNTADLNGGGGGSGGGCGSATCGGSAAAATCGGKNAATFGRCATFDCTSGKEEERGRGRSYVA